MLISRLITIFAVAGSTLALMGCVVEDSRYIETRNPSIDRGYGGHGRRGPIVRPGTNVVVKQGYEITRENPRFIVDPPPPPPSVYDDRGDGSRGYGGRDYGGSRGYGGYGGSR